MRTTEPEEPKTLPNLTIEKIVFPVDFSASDCKTISAMRLEQPMISVGRTALSVEIKNLQKGGGCPFEIIIIIFTL